MAERIGNWTQYWKALFEELEGGGSQHELRSLMAPKFGRLYDRMQRRLHRKSPQQRAIDGLSRRYVAVTTRKYRARRRRR